MLLYTSNILLYLIILTKFLIICVYEEVKVSNISFCLPMISFIRDSPSPIAAYSRGLDWVTLCPKQEIMVEKNNRRIIVRLISVCNFIDTFVSFIKFYSHPYVGNNIVIGFNTY